MLRHQNGRVALFTLLYVSEGGPIGFIWWALPTLFRTEGVAVDRITGLTAMLVLPWTFKFLWAPLVDSLRSQRWGFRAWIIGAQLMMGLTLIPLIRLDPTEHFNWWRALLLAHAFSAATQDVAVDGLAVNVVPASQRGTINGSMQAGMLVGRSLFGGVALLVISKLGHSTVMIGLIACVWSSLFLLLFVREPESLNESRIGLADFAANLRQAFGKRTTWLGLGFALVSAAAFEATGALAGPYLIDRGVSGDIVGWFFALPVVVATLAGGLVGGKLSDVLGRTLSVGIFLAGFVAMILALAAVDHFFAAAPQMVTLAILTGMYLFIGLFTAASYALFMDLTEPKVGATQFSAFMAATNGCESWAGWTGGQIAKTAGYAASFACMSLFSLLSLLLLRRIKTTQVKVIEE
ncbi:MAG: MFS transporter [Blastocatellales bacterium]